MSYIGNTPTTAAFPFDQFSGNGTTTAFTLTYAPASTTSIIVSISGVVQNPNTYSVVGTTLNFSPAPPTGTNNIAVLYLGLPVIGVSSPGNTAYFSSTSFTATGGQTTFTPSGSYQAGFINVIRNGSQLAPADYTATNGTTVTLANPCVAGDVVVIEVFTLTSISNALPLTGGTVTGATTFNSNVTVNGALASGYTGMKNRIINGGMVIDQRNAGASGTAQGYTVDRWTAFLNQTGKFTWQQNAGSVTPPSGFKNYLGATSSSAYSVLATDYFVFEQPIEGLNIADLAWGTASAATITISFWVRSSLTGTFGGSLQNSGQTRSYPFSYSISAANTWEYKTITVAGDTTGAWLNDNGVGIRLNFSLGAGSSVSGTSGAWSGSNFWSATGATSVVGTNGATFYITGVQLERGSNATSFEFRSIGQELALCQRYYENSFGVGLAPTDGSASSFNGGALGATAYSTNALRTIQINYVVPKRATPTVTLYRPAVTATANTWAYYNNATTGWNPYTTSSIETNGSPTTGFNVRSGATATAGVAYMIDGGWAANAEL